MEQQIDVVITWVDGQDEALAARRRQYALGTELQRNDVGGVSRYASIGEIFWCVASINRFAPWVHKIFIVTDGQDPKLTPFLEANFPEGYIPVEIIDHNQIFAGYESFLPTFNSLSIETMLWRIPGLSSQFIELNDDFLFCKPLSPDDFFTAEGYPVCFAIRKNLMLTRLKQFFRSNKNGAPRLTFKRTMIAAAKVIGNKWVYLKMQHTPRALLRDAYEECLGNRPDLIERNIRHRFRDADQFNAEELHYLYLYNQRHLKVRSHEGIFLYLEPKREGYLLEKLNVLKSGKYKFCCFNDLNKASAEELAEVKSWIARTLSINI